MVACCKVCLCGLSCFDKMIHQQKKKTAILQRTKWLRIYYVELVQDVLFQSKQISTQILVSSTQATQIGDMVTIIFIVLFRKFNWIKSRVLVQWAAKTTMIMIYNGKK